MEDVKNKGDLKMNEKEISRDKTVFIITHDMELVDECCTHILKIG